MLRALLASVRSSRDLAPVFAHLGYDTSPGGGDDVVARWRGFRVFAMDDPDPSRRARAFARHLAARAERALVVAVGGDAIAVAAPRLNGGPVTPLLLPTNGAATDTSALEALRPRESSNALGHALRVGEVLSSEPVGHRFFSAFRVVFDRMAGSLDGRFTAADRRLAALLPLTRVLFLYFIQAKGWLDGSATYLPDLLDRTLSARRHFHRSALHPLFFGTLNRPPAVRSTRLDLGRIPYLNGGLFEPHPVERRLGPVLFSNALWRDAFDTLFERFRFCAREATDVNAVAPDMLGHVFERVMDSGERQSTGTFYTPDNVVREIVEATIDAALGNAGDLAALRAIRVLDPAVGSGAFLLGALARLTTLRLGVEPSGARDVRRIRLDVLRHNLFGVDVSPIAVRLAELRLWLAVVADDPTGDISSVAPLPNLDGVVRQGDTLLDPLGLARAYDLSPLPPPRAAVTAVARARNALFIARGASRADAAKTLRRAERALALSVLAGAFRSATAALRDLATKARGADLFGRRSGLDPSERKRWKALQELRGTIRRLLARMRDDAVPFFSFDTHAPDVLLAGGFSVVVGNPPWVRAERLTPAERRALTARFSWWRGAPGKGFAHQPDLAVAFLQRALELARPGGAIGLLVPSKVATAEYGAAARHHLAGETEIVHVHRVAEPDAQRFGAVTYPLAIVARKTPPHTSHRVRIGFDSAALVEQSSWQRRGPWILVPNRLRDALECFQAGGRPLAEVAAPGLGVKTGADDVFVGTVVESRGAVSTVQFGAGVAEIEDELLRPAIRGRDVRPHHTSPAVVLLWPYRGAVVRPVLPPRAARWLAAHDDTLARRSDYKDGPRWTLFRTGAALRPHRVVWADIARVPAAVALDESAAAALPLNTCYVANLPDRETALAFAAVLNSSWALALIHATADEARGGYRRVNARVAGLVPVPKPGPHLQPLIAIATNAHESRHVRQSDLDAAVAAALDLPPAACDALAPFAASLRSHRR